MWTDIRRNRVYERSFSLLSLDDGMALWVSFVFDLMVKSFQFILFHRT